MPVSRKGYPDRLIRETQRTINAYRMLQSGDAVLVGVSGGPDSVALLFVLNQLAPRLSLRLGVAHLNHGLRSKASDRDADFVKSLATRLDLPCYMEKSDIRAHQRRHRLSTEAAARQVRYAFYNKVAARHRFNKIALGHHADDNAELMLMFLLRGSGRPGMAGIRGMRNNLVIRPFIEVGRADIMAFLEQNGIEYVTDRSNQDLRYLRNRVRHRLIPLLKKEYNPMIVPSLNRSSRILRSEDDWMETLAAPLYEKALVKADGQGATLQIAKLQDLPAAAVRRIVRRAIAAAKGDLRRIGFRHIQAISRLMVQGPAHGRLDLPDRIRVRREGQQLIFAKQPTPLRSANGPSGAARSLAAVADYDYEIRAPGAVLIKEVGWSLQFEVLPRKRLGDIRHAGHGTAFFDMDRLQFPLRIRNFRPGDRFTPLGMTGTQKLKKFFSNRKVPREERIRCPLLLSGDTIVWVAGYRIADPVKVRPTTARILKAEQVLA